MSKPDLALIVYQCMDPCPPTRKWMAVLFLPCGSAATDGVSTMFMPWWAPTEDEAAAKAQRVADFIAANLQAKNQWNKGLHEFLKAKEGA